MEEGPDRRFLTTRKTFPALRSSVLELKVLPLLREYGLLDHLIYEKSTHTILNPSNGNVWRFISVDMPERIRSEEWNYVHIEEANEFTWDDFIELRIRMNRPHGPGEVNQIFLSLNPSDEHGWINERLRLADNVTWIRSTYKDNPFLDAAYIHELNALEKMDVRLYKIFALGEYCGRVESIYGPLEVVDGGCPFTPDETIYGNDFGFNNETAVVQVDYKTDFGADHRPTVYLTERLYAKQMTNGDLIRWMETQNIGQNPEIYCDAAEPARIAEIHRAGFNAHPAEKDVVDGIDFVKRFRRITDPRSVNLIREFEHYSWKTDKDERVLDEPVKFDDHCCFIAGTMVMTDQGEKPIESISIGDRVLTRQGYYPVALCGMTDPAATVYTAVFSDGNHLTGTGNHPIFCPGKGFIPLDTLRYGDIIEICKTNALSIKVSHIEDIPKQGSGQIASISRPARISHLSGVISIGRSGLTTMGRFLRVMPFITRMAIRSIMTAPIWSASQSLGICRTTARRFRTTLITWPPSGPLPPLGIEVGREEIGIVNTGATLIGSVNLSLEHVPFVITISQTLASEIATAFARTNASQHGDARPDSIMSPANASIAAKSSQSTDIPRQPLALKSAPHFIGGAAEPNKTSVYNLSVQTVHEFYANGILVSNCDAARYAIYTHLRRRLNAPEFSVVFA